jgi:hypothetical protein
MKKKKKLFGKTRQHFNEDCSTKIGYDYEYQAKGIAKKMIQRHIPVFEVYRCPYCNKWHIGKDYKMVNETF